MAAVTPRAGWRLWLETIRPRTLPAALAPIAVGTGVAWHEGAAHAATAALALVTALLLQVASNLANDVFDFERGADTHERLGPPRATQQGWVSAATMRRATLGVLALAALTGLALVARGGWPIALAGLASLAAAVAYTGGPWPLGYHGLGDLLVFLFFGVVGVVGSHYVQALTFSPAALAAALPVGMLATAILVVNNLRDVETDRKAGKRTLAVRMGAGSTRSYYGLLVLGAPAALAAATLLGALPASALLALLVTPALGSLVGRLRAAEGAALNPLLGATAKSGTLFALALAAGLAL